MYKIYLLSVVILVFCSCSKQQKEEGKTIDEQPKNTLFETVPEAHSGIQFKNKVKETLYFNFLNFSYIYNGGGIAVGDINNDGLEDLYFSSNQGSSALYLNKGNFVFEDITIRAGVADELGWSTGVSMIDINTDGWMDIYVCKSGSLKDSEQRKNKLFINQKDGTFIEAASKYGLASSAFSTQAYYFDYDRDGDIDMYLVNHRPDFRNNVRIDPRVRFEYHPESTDQLFENSNGKFVNVTQKSGILNKAWGLSASIGDFNEDNWPDIYVANDFLESDFLYINNQDGTFTDKILNTFDHIPANSMGSDYADINNDLKPDLLVLDMMSDDHKRSKENMAAMSTEGFNALVDAGYHHQYMSNMLQLNLGKGGYSEVGQLAGVAKTDWSWAPILADFNNDGYTDLFVTNGILHDLSNQDFRNRMRANIMNGKKVTIEEAIGMMPSSKISNKMFMNKGGLSFASVEKEWGVDQKVNSNGVAYADLDNDGDLDLIINNQDDVASIYRNTQKNNFITISLKGNHKNPSGIGSKVTVYSKNLQQHKVQYPVRGFQSSVSTNLHFGLESNSYIDSVKIQWPKGEYQVLTNIKGNQNLKIEYDVNQVFQKQDQKDVVSLIDATSFGIHYKNEEYSFDDYKLQLLLPQKQSEKGRALAVADVNNDGLDDFFVGNGKGAMAALYIQQENQKFESSSNLIFEKDIDYEDNKALFFDMDNDGDLDLYVASGSYEDQPNSIWLQDRIYANDGKGNFTKSDILPDIKTVSSAVAVSDIDMDGDLDIFVGGGVEPGRYPLSSASYILKNNSGKFVLEEKNSIQGLEEVKIVNEALFTDYDNDKDQDLILVGEWMPITIFENDKGKFTMKGDILSDSSGWYFTIKSTDIDKDGDIDYVVGNIGNNTKFQPKKDKPLHIYAKDFDKNGSLDIILSKTSKTGLLVPVRGKQCSSEQVPMLTTKFKTYGEFANASLPDIYGDKNLKEATHFVATEFSTMLLVNNGKGDFERKKLPVQAQFGPTTDFVIDDFNNDGSTDIFGIGSLYEAEVETIRYDANKGYFLFGDTKKPVEFYPTLAALHTLETKAAEQLTIGDKKYILLLCKNEGLRLLPMSN